MTQPADSETMVAHLGWLRHEAGDEVGNYLRQGWFEYQERAFCHRYLREGDCFVDGGAHVGLFTMLAARAVGPGGRVVPVEPNDRSLSLLGANLKAHKFGSIEPIRAALSDVAGEATFHAGEGRLSAYSSLTEAAVGERQRDQQVPLRTLDEIAQTLGLERIDLLKLDIEGAEPRALRGAGGLLAARRVAVIMIEFTEANLQAAGESSQGLARAVADVGYTLCRYDASTSGLVPEHVSEPIEYSNLFAVADVEAANSRLADPPARQRRIADDVLRRGEAAFSLLRDACEVRHYRDLVKQLKSDLQEGREREAVLEHQLRHTPWGIWRRVNRHMHQS